MKKYLLLACIVLAEIVPFSSRAVYMDEHIFLHLAESAQHHWLFPSDTPGLFFGIPIKNFAAHTHGPVGEYYLALIYAVVGRFSEIPFRLAFSIFSIAAVLAFYFIARRYTDEPFFVALLFAVSPAFFVMSPTLMMDIPMLAFLLVGMAFYFAHLEKRPYCLAAAAIAFILSAGTGFTALIPMFFLFLLLLLGRRPWRELLAVAAAPIALAVWQIGMALHFGEVPLAKTVGFYSHHLIFYNAAATLSFIGSVMLFPWTILFAANVPRKKAVVLLSIGIASGIALFVPAHSIFYRLWYATLAASGIAMLVAFAAASRRIIQSGRNHGEALFILWVPATLIFFILVGDMITARYMLLAMPPLYLLVLRHSSRRQLLYAIVPTAALAITLAYADFRFVNSYRDWVKNTIPALHQEGFQVWGAAESGLRFYLEQTGISSLSKFDLRPAGTDLIVRQSGAFKYGLSSDVETMLTVLKTFSLNTAFPIRTYNQEAGAGFHDSNFGVVPFVFSRLPLDRLEISQVSPFVEHLPQTGSPAEEIPAWSPTGVILKENEPERTFPVKFPAGAKLEYEIDGGEGVAEREDGAVLLRKLTPAIIVWRRFRIVPPQFETPGQGQR